MTGGYDEGYRACPCFWGKEAGSLVKWLAARDIDFNGTHILDAGCGEGKNAVFFAHRGARVHSLDISETAITNARRAWGDSDNPTFEVADIVVIPTGEQEYDVVVAYGLLHCLADTTTITAVVEKLQRATKTGGYNIVCAFNSRNQDLRAHPTFNPCLAAHEFYLGLYADWELLTHSDADLVETHPHNGIEHHHALTRLIARKSR